MNCAPHRTKSVYAWSSRPGDGGATRGESGMKNQGNISCTCGVRAFVLNDCTPVMALLSACEDCRQASQWAAKRGGAAFIDIYYSVYCRSGFAEIVGSDNIHVTQIREDAKSTRIYCKTC